MTKLLSDLFYQQATILIKKYPNSAHALLPLLHIAQDQYGYLSIPVIKEIASYLQLPFNHVLGVVTFYSMYKTEQQGKHYIGVCTNLSCWLRGGVNLYNEIYEFIQNNCANPQEYFIEQVECLGACGYAPVVMLNRDYIENADLTKINNWIKQLNLEFI